MRFGKRSEGRRTGTKRDIAAAALTAAFSKFATRTLIGFIMSYPSISTAEQRLNDRADLIVIWLVDSKSIQFSIFGRAYSQQNEPRSVLT